MCWSYPPNSSYWMVAGSFGGTSWPALTLVRVTPAFKLMNSPGGSLKLPIAPTSFQPLLLHLYLCICGQLLLFALSSGISKAPASSLQSTVPASSTTSFPIRQSLKNHPQLRHFAAILYPEHSPASPTPGVTSCRTSL